MKKNVPRSFQPATDRLHTELIQKYCRKCALYHCVYLKPEATGPEAEVLYKKFREFCSHRRPNPSEYML